MACPAELPALALVVKLIQYDLTGCLGAAARDITGSTPRERASGPHHLGVVLEADDDFYRAKYKTLCKNF
jgi:hypothetical protein